MAETFNPYGSAISRSNLFVYDPNPFMAKTLDKGQKELQKGLDELVATRKKEVQYANDILNNLGALKDQAELEHNNFINARVDTLVEQVKGNMTKKGKLGLVSFNFNNPEFQLQLRQGVNQIKRGINNSKLLKDQYDDFVKFLNVNKDVVSNQVELLNRASQNVTNPVNIFTANDVTTSFTNLKNEAIDEVKYINNVAQGKIESADKETLIYETEDSSGKKLTIKGEFNKNLYEKDEMGIIKRVDGKPVLNEEVVKNLRDEIINNEFTPEKAKIWLQDANNFEQFKDMISADLIIKERTEQEQADLEKTREQIEASKRSGRGDGDGIPSLKLKVNRYDEDNVLTVPGIATLEDEPFTAVDSEGNVLENVTLDNIIEIGTDQRTGKNVIVVELGPGKNVVIKEGTNVVDALTGDNADKIENVGSYTFTQESIDKLYNKFFNQSITGELGNKQEKEAFDFYVTKLIKNKNRNTQIELQDEDSYNNVNKILEGDSNNNNQDVKEKTLNQKISEYNIKNKENRILLDEYDIVENGYPIRSEGEIKARITPQNIDTFVYDERKGGENNLAGIYDSKEEFEKEMKKLKDRFNSNEYKDILNRYNKFKDYLNE